MATYKVLQDIEAEDTLVGPLTLRQCIYAAVAALAGYLCFVSVLKHASFLVVLWLPFVAFGVFFAFPWSKQQPTEVWALAKVRFYFKPRRRIWNQSGVKQLVTITVPKAPKRLNTRNLTQDEVQKRLRALADTIDSRGWAVKNIDLSSYMQASGGDDASDRLLEASALPQEVQQHDSADIFDVQNSAVAQKFDAMMNQAASAHRQQLVSQLSQQTAPEGLQAAEPVPASYWHMKTILPTPVAPGGQPQLPPLPYGAQQPDVNTTLASAGAPSSAAAWATIAPTQAGAPAPGTSQVQSPPQASQSIPQASQTPPAPQVQPGANAAQPTMTDTANPAILELAQNNDLNVATLAREAQARSGEPPEEVSVSFH